MSHSTEGPGVGAALGIFCKFEPSQHVNIAFLALEKGTLKGVIVKTNDDSKLLLF